MSEEKIYVTPYISNKRFQKIQERLEDRLRGYDESSELQKDILQIICDETNYDPHVKQYNERKAETIKRYQKKKKEEKLYKK